MGSGMALEGRSNREKGKENYGVLATRNPMKLNLSAGALLPREDARQRLSKMLQEPPRRTRLLPVGVPAGSTTGADP